MAIPTAPATTATAASSPSTDPLTPARVTTYDAFDRVLTQTDALGATTRYAYDNATRSAVLTTPEGVTVTTVHNRFGQLQSIRDGNNNVTSYAYDRNGNLLSTVEEGLPSGQNASTSTYDHAGRLFETTDAQRSQGPPTSTTPRTVS